jgi:putative ABC transport system permease protein
MTVSYQNYLDWRDQSTSFEAVGAVRNAPMTLTGREQPERLIGQMATANLLDLLGVQLALGRAFLPAEDRAAGPPVALISYGLWQRHFAGAADVLGQAVTLDNKQYSIVGVLPAGFQLVQQSPDVMLPFEPWAKTLPDDRSWHPGIQPIARLKPNVSLEQARAEMTAIAKRLEQQYPVYDTGTGANVDRMQDMLVKNVRPALLTLLGAVAFVLLIACTNVANLLLARAAAREREIAIRAAIGASRGRILQQLLTESVLLAATGAAFGLLLAYAAMTPLLRLAATSLPGNTNPAPDLWVLAFATAIAALAGIACGLAPALHSWRVDVRSALSATDRGGVDAGTLRVRGALVVTEVAVAMLLLAGAGLLIRSFDRLSSVAPGFATDHILIADLPVSPGARPKANERMDFFDAVLERSAALPGVRTAGAASFLPLSGNGSVIHFNIQGRPPKSAHEFIIASYRAVSAGYLRTLAVPLVQGRWFTDADRESAPAVVIINQTMARTYFPNRNPLGEHMQLGALPDKTMPWMEVVGVVGDIRGGLDSDPPTEMYVPFRQANAVLPVFSLSVVMRTANDPLTLAAAFRALVHDIDANQPVVKIRTMDDNLATSISQPRFRTVLLSIFAAIALLLAAVGIYGVMAYSVTQRTREIGIRMALGSTPAGVFRIMIGHALRLTAIGVVAGLVAAFALTRYLASLLFQVRVMDPVTLVSVILLLGIVSLLASYLPARRATRVHPVIALRYE